MDSSNLKELASQKEKEWKEVTELRIKSLETDLKEKCQSLEDEKNKFFKLKEDFKYNLKLMNERDKELEQYDLLFKELRQKITLLSTEKSELQIKMDELKTTAEREAKNREDLQIHYQKRLREKQKEIDGFRQAKEGEVDQERKEYEAFKRKLERRLTELEEELDAQRRELTTGFDDAMKKREHEFRVKLDEMSSQVLAHELKAKLLTKELEMHKAAQSKTTEEFQQVETTQKELEKQLRKKDWELADLKSVKESQISELEGKLSRSEVLVKKLQEGFEQRYAELDRYGREKEAALTRLKEALVSKEEGHKEALHQLQNTLQQNQEELRQLRWTSQDLAKEKELQVERLMAELTDMRETLEQQVVEMSRDQVAKDVLYQDMRSQVDKLSQELSERKEDVSRYKRELSSALERESQAERSRAQTELDWQRRCEDVERQQYSKSEDLVGKLTQARDQAVADLKQKERECEDQVKVIQQLRKDKASAMAMLKQHGLGYSSDHNAVSDPVSEEEELWQLRAQNQTLMAAVTEMREAMEELGHRVKDTPASRSALTVTKDYTQSLESQVRDLKKEKRDLEQELELYKQKKTMDDKTAEFDPGSGDVIDNVIIRSHIQSLNDSIGALRAEKVELTAQLKKQQARILYLEKTTDAAAKQHRQKQLEVDQLQYEAHAEGRRLKAESVALKQRVTDLELELAETRKEADEYYRSGLERNMEVTALTAELSNLKMDLAEKRPTVNFGAQELVIQQLEDEIQRLKKYSHVTSSETIRSGQGQTTNATLQQLQTKLKSAAKHIAQLARDKQLLIEIGNRQRAELLKAGITPPSASSKPEVRADPGMVRQLSPLPAEQPFSPANPLGPATNSMSDRIQDKLDALEKLQYQLTKQELQYAQKFSPKRSAGMPRSARSRGDNHNRPVSILKKSGDSFVSDAQTGLSTLTDGRTEDELMLTMSSAGDSLQEVWGVLNQPSPSPVPSKHTHEEREVGNVSSAWLIKGKKADIATQQTHPTGKQRRTLPAKKHPQKPKVRNYNVKDGVS